jgi:hypothetical protein
LVFGDYVRRFMDPFETASQSGENMEEQFSCTVCLTLYRCLAVVQYEQIGENEVIGRSVAPCSMEKVVRHSTKGFANVGYLEAKLSCPARLHWLV